MPCRRSGPIRIIMTLTQYNSMTWWGNTLAPMINTALKPAEFMRKLTINLKALNCLVIFAISVINNNQVLKTRWVKILTCPACGLPQSHTSSHLIPYCQLNSNQISYRGTVTGLINRGRGIPVWKKTLRQENSLSALSSPLWIPIALELWGNSRPRCVRARLRDGLRTMVLLRSYLCL